MHDGVVKYLPYLSKSGYDGTTIKNLLQMTACVDWTGDWEDAGTERPSNLEDISPLEDHDMNYFFPALLTGDPSFRKIAKSTIRGPIKPGQQFAYQNMNTITLGLILEEVYRAPLNEIMAAKLWKPGGMEADAFFWRGKKQPDFQACGGLNATLRDYARYGRMIAHNGVANGRQVIPASWVGGLSQPDLEFLRPKPTGSNGSASMSAGYNHQWWICYGDGENHPLFALGSFGQMIYVDPQRDFVAVQTSAQKEGANWRIWNEMLAVFGTLAEQC